MSSPDDISARFEALINKWSPTPGLPTDEYLRSIVKAMLEVTSQVRLAGTSQGWVSCLILETQAYMRATGATQPFDEDQDALPTYDPAINESTPEWERPQLEAK